MSDLAAGTRAGDPQRNQDFADSRNTWKETETGFTTPQMALCGCGASSVILPGIAI